MLKKGQTSIKKRLPKKTSKSIKQSQASLLTRLINNRAEKKQLDLFVSDSSLVTTATGSYVNCLNQVAEGDDSINRTGRSINHNYLELDVMISPALTLLSSNSLTCFSGRMTVVLDKQPNQATAAYNSIYDATIVTNLAQTFRNVLVYPDRFQVLYSEVISFPNSQGMYKNKIFINLQKMLKGKEQEAKYAATAAAVPSTGAILLTFANDVTSGNASNSNAYIITYASRYRFTDL